ncbi:MAG: YHS domain protein [Spirochaetia bacterium]|nr:YHS domain protein [Spirochaetia bacterium]
MNLNSKSNLQTSLKALLIGLALTAGLSAEPLNKSFFGNKAIHGYDAVSYFKGKPVPGSADISMEYRGAVWFFATRENLAEFRARPAAFAPQYGGYCAYAVANGYLADVDPLSWRIVSGKLYLNYDSDIQKKWEATRAEMIRNADSNFADMSKSK